MDKREWMRVQKDNWPKGSKERSLQGKTALQALEEKKKELGIKPKELKGLKLEFLSDEELAIAVAGSIIKGMHHRGIRRATREANRERDTKLSGNAGHPGIQDQEPGNLRSSEEGVPGPEQVL